MTFYANAAQSTATLGFLGLDPKDYFSLYSDVRSVFSSSRDSPVQRDNGEGRRSEYSARSKSSFESASSWWSGGMASPRPSFASTNPGEVFRFQANTTPTSTSSVDSVASRMKAKIKYAFNRFGRRSAAPSLGNRRSPSPVPTIHIQVEDEMETDHFAGQKRFGEPVIPGAIHKRARWEAGYDV